MRCEDDIMEFDLDDLTEALMGNVKKDIKDFDDILNLDCSLNREYHLGGIEDNTGTSMAGVIRFWNKWDDAHNIPVEKRQPIKIYIDSAGGDLCATLTIIDAIKLSKTPIWTINDGAAYSGGFFIFICGNRRFTMKHSTFLYHEGSTGAGGTSIQFENYSQFYKDQLKQLREITLENTKISTELYEEKRKEDWWIFADEAIELGICDEIIKEFV